MRAFPFTFSLCILTSTFALAQELYEFPEASHSRWSSFENPAAAKGAGGLENKGGKGHAFEPLKAGQAIDLLNISGSGSVRRIWLTVSDRSPEMMRALKIEMFWDGEEKPAVSAPLGDFFGIGLGRRLPFESALFSDPEGRSFNCVIPMPFRTGARITITNESDKDLEAIFYDVNLLLEKHGSESMYFHTYWSRAMPTTLAEDFLLLPKIQGRGRFLGTNVGIQTHPSYRNTWWGEGEVKIFLDGDTSNPSLIGSGTEDYIGTAYGQGSFSHQYQGSPLAEAETGQYAFYRYHIPDPVYFHTDIKVQLQQIGGGMKEEVRSLLQERARLQPVSIHNKEGFVKLLEREGEVTLEEADLPDGWTNFYRQDDVSATAYFYLDRPTNSLPPLAEVKSRMPEGAGPE